ncbi:MAG: YabD protein [Parcubacteria group bacterium GW2011_GWC1_38_6]|nr:MAG: YabD protein [Parcubacteria group bacterium GW2011_GWA1_36_12]KKQ76242.1 MAG: YabD protein [Parcubacteria group bacterium GW2011_GWC1_38_6]
MLIDTHAHLNFSAYKEDIDEVIKRTLDNNIWVINVGSQGTTSKRAVELAEKYGKGLPAGRQGVFAAVGLHPIHLEERKVDISEVDPQNVFTTRAEEFDYNYYKELVRSANSGQAHPKVVAIGEIGLDYYYRPKTKIKLEAFKKKQKDTFLQQLNLAKELNLPVIFHSRVAHKDLIGLLKSNPEARPDKAVAHGFVGNSEELKEYLNFGYSIGINGIIFKKIEGIDFEANIKQIPIGQIVVETDAPYLSPPMAPDRNEPIYLKYIVEEIARIKGMGYERVEEATTENALKLFDLNEI